MVKFIADNRAWKESHGRGVELSATFLFVATIIDSFSERLRKTFSRVSPILATRCRIIGKGPTDLSRTCWRSAIRDWFRYKRNRDGRSRRDKIVSAGSETETRRGVRRVRESHVARFTCRRRARRSRSYLDNRNFAIQPALHPAHRRCNVLKREKEGEAKETTRHGSGVAQNRQLHLRTREVKHGRLGLAFALLRQISNLSFKNLKKKKYRRPEISFL